MIDNMITGLRLAPNNDPDTTGDFPWSLIQHGTCVALFTKKTLAREFLQTQGTARRMEDDASRYRAMYLGVTARRAAR